MAIKLFLMRHGESTDDIDNQYGGWADFPLTEKGRGQAVDAARKLATEKVKFGAVFCSPLKRASETAKIVCKALDLPAPQVCELWKERNTYGILTGMRKDEAKQKFPLECAKRERDEWVLGSERFEDAVKRVEAGLDYLRANTAANSKILLVTHGGMLRCLYEGVFNEPHVSWGDCEYRVKEVK